MMVVHRLLQARCRKMAYCTKEHCRMILEGCTQLLTHYMKKRVHCRNTMVAHTLPQKACCRMVTVSCMTSGVLCKTEKVHYARTMAHCMMAMETYMM